MSKVAVVYWSSTGNTEAMANAVAEGAKAAGAEVDLLTPSEFDATMVGNYSTIAFGCSAMGDEELDPDEFGPMFEAVEGSLIGKKIGLFGSYGWGDGAWMRSWKERVEGDGAMLVADFVICNEMPDDDGLEECRALGKALAI